MKHMKTYAAILAVAALAVGALAGCGGQAASSASASASASTSASSSASASASASESAGDAAGDLAKAIASTPVYKSVTLTATVVANGDEKDPIVNIAKFDLSGEKVKSTIETTIRSDTTTQYLDGDEVVVDFGGDAYKGTVAEMNAENMQSADAFVKTLVGDSNTLMNCASDVQKAVEGENVRYTVTVDPEKLAEADELFAALAKTNEKLNAMTVSYVFDADGRIASIENHEDLGSVVTDRVIAFSDYGATTVGSAPATDKTYEDYKKVMDEIASQAVNETSSQASSDATK